MAMVSVIKLTRWPALNVGGSRNSSSEASGYEMAPELEYKYISALNFEAVTLIIKAAANKANRPAACVSRGEAGIQPTSTGGVK